MDSRNDALAHFLFSQLRNRIAAAINHLPEQERLIITLYYYEEFTLAQIGIIVGMSYTATSRTYASGLMNLRARLGDQAGNWEPNIHTAARPPTNGLTDPKGTGRASKTSEDKLR